jgi:hypothetical protein
MMGHLDRFRPNNRAGINGSLMILGLESIALHCHVAASYDRILAGPKTRTVFRTGPAGPFSTCPDSDGTRHYQVKEVVAEGEWGRAKCIR